MKWLTGLFVFVLLVEACSNSVPPARQRARPGPLPLAPPPPATAPLIVNRVGERDTVMGLVWDGATGAPIDGVTIGVPGTTSYTIADDRGRFRLPLHAGKHVIVTRRNGYVERRDTVKIAAGQGMSLGIRLWRQPSTLVEICDCFPGGRLVLELKSTDSTRAIREAIVVVRGPGVRETKVDTIRASDFLSRSTRRDYLAGRDGVVSVEVKARGFKGWSAEGLKLPTHLAISLRPRKR